MARLKEEKMKDLISLSCPNCGSQLEVSSTEMKTNCKYCGAQVLIKDFITERRVDKADRIASLMDMISNSVNIGNFAKAYKYSEEMCKLDSSKKNIALLNLYGFMSGENNFNYSILDELYLFTPDEHRAYLEQILTTINNNKRNELKNASSIINEQQRQAETIRINNYYQPIHNKLNSEIKKLKKKMCKCGYMIEYNENVCPECGLNYSDYQAELIKARKEKNNKIIKLSIIVSIPLLIIVFIFALIYNNALIENIHTAIDNKNYSSAEQMIDSYQEANPSRIDVYELYADLYLAQGEPEKAIEKLDEGLRKVNSSDMEKLQSKIDYIKSEYHLN